jgi:hypothetical protein
MRIRGIAAIAGIVAGLVVVSGGALVAAGVALHTTAGVKAYAEPSPILGPITPAGHPYDQLAILRRQRMSDDVMPDGVVKALSQNNTSPILTASARLIVTLGKEREWLAATPTGGVCVVSTTLGQDGYTEACRSDPVEYGAGQEVFGVGTSGYVTNLEIISDGTPRPGTVVKGNRQVAPNIWMSKKSRGTVPTVTSGLSDPLAFPPTHPYSDFAILRRGPAASDVLPAGVSKAFQQDSIGASIIPSTVRLAGRVHGTTVWVGADVAGGACLVTYGSPGSGDPGASTGCADSPSGGGVGTSYGSGADSVYISLQPDHNDGSPEKGAVHLAPNVWATVGGS